LRDCGRHNRKCSTTCYKSDQNRPTAPAHLLREIGTCRSGRPERYQPASTTAP
jgi:hypothetical protein